MIRKAFSDEIREAVRASGRSCYDIARELNTATSTMTRFLNGEVGLSLAMLDKLAALLGLHCVVRKGK
jgi:ribosome-binding protein aMBF1 (putative translation factor)